MDFLRVPRTPPPPRRDIRVRSLLSGLIGLVAVATSVAPAAAAVSVHTADEVLASWTSRSGDALFFRSPEGESWELVTDIADPAISNKGLGAFYPVDPALARDAVDAVNFPLGALDAQVFILPYPRRDLIPSSAGENCIYLSPGVAPMSAAQVHALVAHELGHLVHRKLLPDANTAGWNAYRALRGITDTAVYNDSAVHKNRPHEIFAEDFRFLFGGALANYSGGIENPALALPTQVAGLQSFFLNLSGTAGAGIALVAHPILTVSPNPSRGPVRIALLDGSAGVGGPVMVSVFDVQGRRVAVRSGAGPEMGWDARGDDGAPVPPGLYFVRVTRGGASWRGKVLIAP